jgi:hypothetical protein
MKVGGEPAALTDASMRPFAVVLQRVRFAFAISLSMDLSPKGGES